MRPSNWLTHVSLFAATCSAWPWPSDWEPLNAVKREIAPLVVRQDEGASSTKTSFDLTFSGTQGNTATTADSSRATSDNSDASTTGTDSGSSTGTADGTSSGKTTEKATGSITGTDSSGSRKKTSATQTSFSPNVPQGGISMVTPNSLTSQYYKIGEPVTLAWNFTSLSITPSAVDVLATCASNSETYTIATNRTVSNATQSLTWDTNEFQKTASVTLLTASYTLIVYDAAKDVSSTPSPGYLGTSDQFTFGMYMPQFYADGAQYVCATCNAAVSSIEKQTMSFILGMAVVTVLSFSWFAGVAGLW